MAALEREFDDAMAEIYRRAKAECGYRAVRFLQMLTEHGGLGTVKRLLASDEIQYGFTELWERGRLDLTVEAHVLKPEFQHCLHLATSPPLRPEKGMAGPRL